MPGAGIKRNDLAILGEDLIARGLIRSDGGERLQAPGPHPQVARFARKLERAARRRLRAIAIASQPQHAAQIAVDVRDPSQIADAAVELQRALVLFARFLIAVEIR